jgi:hypothetical protein
MKQNIKHTRRSVNRTAKVLAAALCILQSSLFTACQDHDLPTSAPMMVEAPEASQIVGKLSGDYDYTLTWPQPSNGRVMNVAVFKNGTQMQALTPCQGNSFTLKNLESKQL